jgi:hypothetical protein
MTNQITIPTEILEFSKLVNKPVSEILDNVDYAKNWIINQVENPRIIFGSDIFDVTDDGYNQAKDTEYGMVSCQVASDEFNIKYRLEIDDDYDNPNILVVRFDFLVTEFWVYDNDEIDQEAIEEYDTEIFIFIDGKNELDYDFYD